MTPDAFYSLESPDIARFAFETEKTLAPEAAPHAAAIEKNIPVYDGPALRAILEDTERRRAIQSEWAHVLGHLSGVIVIRQAQPDHAIIDRATALFEDIIVREKQGHGGKGDHFAAAGANDRIWNSLQKLCEADPETFALYHASPEIDAACEAWLGPNYQLTAQVNLVRPGGQAQTAHRDYHLGFMSPAEATAYPVAIHHLSPYLTLQGGLAHVDTPLEAGPTKLLPFSQTYGPGYLAYEKDAFRDHFETHSVQLPLSKGDALFFNPALFHAAGENRSADIQRLVNLFQVSSAFGRAMETVDRTAMSKALYPVLRQLLKTQRLGRSGATAAIAAAAEGYAFPTNLDTDPPVDGLAPETQARFLHRALAEDMAEPEVLAGLDAQAARRTA
jgi:ectoine hydroxylase-related dioxygenase (phytanoyl-CoA dioxygenase family)